MKSFLLTLSILAICITPISSQSTLGVFVSGESFTYKLDTWADPGITLGIYNNDRPITSGWYKEIRIGASHTDTQGTTAQAAIGGGYLFANGIDMKILPRMTGIFNDTDWYIHLGVGIGYQVSRYLTVYGEYSFLPSYIGTHTFGISAYTPIYSLP